MESEKGGGWVIETLTDSDRKYRRTDRQTDRHPPTHTHTHIREIKRMREIERE